MTITTVAINCDIGLANGTEFTAAQIEFTLSEADYDTVSNDSIPAATTVVDLDASGVGTANLWPVTRGTRNTQYSVVLIGSRTINGRMTSERFTLGAIQPPATGAPFKLADLLAQSSGGIVVGSTIYATLADAVAAAVAVEGAAEAAQAAAEAAQAATEAARDDAIDAVAEITVNVGFADVEGGDLPVILTDNGSFMLAGFGGSRAYIAGLDAQREDALSSPVFVGNDGFVIGEAQAEAADLTPYFGTNFYGVAGVDLSIHSSGLIANRAHVQDMRLVLSGNAMTEGPRMVKIAADLLGPAARLQLRANDDFGAPHIELPLSVYAAPQDPVSGGSPIVLTVGDSITQRAGTAWCAYWLAEWGYTPTFIGTLGSESDGPATAKLGEGKPGHTLRDLTYAVTNRVGPLAPGDEALYAAMSVTDKRLYNTMIRAATGGDAAQDIRNGYVLDFPFYVSRHGLTTPTILSLGYGTNDIRDVGPGSLEDLFYEEDSLVYRRWHAAYPTAPVVRWMPGTAWDLERNEVWFDSYIPAIRGMLRAAIDAAGPVLLVPTWAMHTAEAGFDLTAPTETPDPVTGHIRRQILDTIHPVDGTRRELFKALAAGVACAATGNY